MTNKMEPAVENGDLVSGFLARTGLVIGLLALVGAGCTRSTPSTPPSGATTSAVKAGGTDCEGVSKALTYKFESANYWEHQLKVLKDQNDMQACARACVELPDCKVATFTDSTVPGGWANSCVLRSAVGARHPESGICSWVKP
ncbi:MAG: hypothetical protein H7X95_03620 [Deltaproteobacteria bacterium]|nr:hypothetical protein [Deltaproteobacteria bacterium]